MRALVAFYSRTGNTRKLAHAIAEELDCDIEEIVDTKDRNGALGYMLAGKDASFKIPAPIKDAQKDPALYDIVLIGTPVWAWTVSAPVRAYLLQNKDKFRQVAFFCTHSGSESKAFIEMESLCGKKPAGALGINEKDLESGAYVQNVKEFLKLTGI